MTITEAEKYNISVELVEFPVIERRRTGAHRQHDRTVKIRGCNQEHTIWDAISKHESFDELLLERDGLVTKVRCI